MWVFSDRPYVYGKYSGMRKTGEVTDADRINSDIK